MIFLIIIPTVVLFCVGFFIIIIIVFDKARSSQFWDGLSFKGVKSNTVL